MTLVGDGKEIVHEGHYEWRLAYGENTIEITVKSGAGGEEAKYLVSLTRHHRPAALQLQPPPPVEVAAPDPSKMSKKKRQKFKHEVKDSQKKQARRRTDLLNQITGKGDRLYQSLQVDNHGHHGAALLRGGIARTATRKELGLKG
jgi:hypothetical protein